ncbi:short chain dehydrogenase [Phytohabitans aurantiacus]|uniref:Short chain dehydrogenase n=1 Tax=Phytohabitans aurantiacus TaxID=3016789 RepID=A0ABQ5R1T3_9ACTN|nr:short chain dehydrogenase [Phytohabitans aurantiacus]
MLNPLDFAGRAVLVTGGTRGIGAGIAARFLAAGADVLVCARTAPAALPEVDGRTARFVAADVRDPYQASAAVRATVDAFGRLDAVVNNAGGAPYADAATVSPRFHAKVIELNLIAPLHVSQAAYAVMREQPGGGAIVMVGSVSGVRPSPGTAAYGAAKAGLHHLAASLAVEWAPAVRINSIVVGMIATELSGEHYADIEAVAGTVPLGRLGTPDDVADACLFLASPLASYVTGAALTVHGGGEWPAYLRAQVGMSGE